MSDGRYVPKKKKGKYVLKIVGGCVTSSMFCFFSVL